MYGMQLRVLKAFSKRVQKMCEFCLLKMQFLFALECEWIKRKLKNTLKRSHIPLSSAILRAPYTIIVPKALATTFF